MEGFCIILEEDSPAHLWKMRYNMWVQDFVIVLTTFQVPCTQNNNLFGSAVVTDALPDHYAATLVSSCGLNNGLWVSFTSVMPNPDTSVIHVTDLTSLTSRFQNFDQ